MATLYNTSQQVLPNNQNDEWWMWFTPWWCSGVQDLNEVLMRNRLWDREEWWSGPRNVAILQR